MKQCVLENKIKPDRKTIDSFIPFYNATVASDDIMKWVGSFKKLNKAVPKEKATKKALGDFSCKVELNDA